ncbi:MAG: caspase family protein [Cyclobacteriaceae bacterium]|nr:caspase family protein [Cyclobacteriaceae bacterium]
MKRSTAFLLLIALSLGAIAQKRTPKTQPAPVQPTSQSTVFENNQADDLRLGYDIGKDALTQLKVVTSPDGRYLAIAYINVADTLKGWKEKLNSYTLKIFDVQKQRFIYSLRNFHLTHPYLMVFAGSRLVFMTTTGLSATKPETWINVYDITTGKEPMAYLIGKGLNNPATLGSSLMYSEATQLILFSRPKNIMTARQFITAFDAHSFVEKYVVEIGSIESETIIDPTGKYIAFLRDHQIKLLDASTGKEISSFSGANSGAKEYSKISFDFNGNLICLFDNLSGEKDNIRLEVISLSNRTSKEFKFPELKDKYAEILELNGDNLLWGNNTEFKVFSINDGSIKYRMNSDNKAYTMANTAFQGIVFFSKHARLSNNKYLLYTTSPARKQGEFVYINSSKIFDLDAMQITGYFYCDGSDNYAVVARDGRVDGDMDALKNVYWTSRRSTEKTYLERTLDKNFTPKLLSQILSGENISRATFDIDNVITRIPTLTLKSFNSTSSAGATFKSQSKSNKLEVTVTANASEIEEVRLHHNGKLVKSQSNNGSSQYSFDVSLTNSFGSANYFFVTATSKSGIEAEKVKFTVEYSGASAEAPKLYLLTVGINTYRNPKYNLNYAQADADGVENLVKTNSASLFPNIVTYSIRNDKAVKVNIINAFEDIKSKALEQDLLIVYYAGHGVMSGQETQSRDFFLVPHDVTQLYGRDDMLTEKGISAAELRKYSQSINAQKQVFILDACQSSGALEALAVRGAAEEKAIAQLARSTGTFWITSTGTNQFATEFDKLGHGIFTHTLLEGIKGQGDTNQDKKLTVRELSTFVENLVPELTEKLNGTPQFPSAYSFGNDFILTLYK